MPEPCPGQTCDCAPDPQSVKLWEEIHMLHFEQVVHFWNNDLRNMAIGAKFIKTIEIAEGINETDAKAKQAVKRLITKVIRNPFDEAYKTFRNWQGTITKRQYCMLCGKEMGIPLRTEIKKKVRAAQIATHEVKRLIEDLPTTTEEDWGNVVTAYDNSVSKSTVKVDEQPEAMRDSKRQKTNVGTQTPPESPNVTNRIPTSSTNGINNNMPSGIPTSFSNMIPDGRTGLSLDERRQRIEAELDEARQTLQAAMTNARRDASLADELVLFAGCLAIWTTQKQHLQAQLDLAYDSSNPGEIRKRNRILRTLLLAIEEMVTDLVRFYKAPPQSDDMYRGIIEVLLIEAEGGMKAVYQEIERSLEEADGLLAKLNEPEMQKEKKEEK